MSILRVLEWAATKIVRFSISVGKFSSSNNAGAIVVSQHATTRFWQSLRVSVRGASGS